jgi:hypothetical protein
MAEEEAIARVDDGACIVVVVYDRAVGVQVEEWIVPMIARKRRGDVPEQCRVGSVVRRQRSDRVLHRRLVVDDVVVPLPTRSESH